MKKQGRDIIGKTYTSKKGFPKASNPYDADGQYIKVGERFKIIDYDKEANEYKLLNLNLGTTDAWFIVNQSELDYILRRGETA